MTDIEETLEDTLFLYSSSSESDTNDGEDVTLPPAAYLNNSIFDYDSDGDVCMDLDSLDPI